MTARGHVRAKLSRPRLHHAIARERLFSKLDQGRAEKQAICVVGPPGSGKTTLVASWLESRDIQGIWYQVDEGDADLATLFFYLKEAALPFARKASAELPSLTPEYQNDVQGFGRRFFRDLYAMLPDDGVLVLDNYQEVAPDSPFHVIISDAVNEVTAGQSLVVVSRRDPPACYVRLIANDNVAFLDWEELRFTVDETRALAEERGRDLGQDIGRLHAASGGWAAGVTLMLEGRRRSSSLGPTEPSEQDLLFDYFATQIFSQLSTREQRFLMLTASLQQVPVGLARDLTDDRNAAEILENLYRRHLFTHRKTGKELTYWYHALFREFLLTQGTRILSVVERRENDRRAARLLEASGDIDDACLLYRGAQDWEAVARLIIRQAESLLAHGRGQTLREWIAALPSDWLDRDPWLRFWLGTSLIPVNQAQARRELEAVYAKFGDLGNREGRALAAAGVLESYHFEWSVFAPMACWVQRLEPLIDGGLHFPMMEHELKLYSSMLMGIFYGLPRHGMLDRCVRRVTEMLDESLSPGNKVKAATFLLAYCNVAGDLARGHTLAQRISAIVEAQGIAPLDSLWWYVRLGHFQSMVGDLVAASQAFARARSVAERNGLATLPSAMLLLKSYETHLACLAGDSEAARRLIDETDSLARDSRPMDACHVAHTRAYLSTLLGDAGAMVHWGRQAVEAAERAGLPYTVIITLLYQGHGLAILGENDLLKSVLQRVRELIAGTCMIYFECEVRFLLAYSALRGSSSQSAKELAASAVNYARVRGYHYPYMARFSPVQATVMASCLESGMEVDYLTDTIRRLRIRPPDTGVPRWPWAIKVLTLGRFEIQVDGLALRFAGKTPRKPIALLKAIVALGGKDVPLSKIVDALWPDDDGDAAKQSFSVTLVRLRKLLRVPDAIVLADERVTLSTSHCWVDSLAFEAQCRQLDLRPHEEIREELVARMESTVSLYQGSFLPTDPDAFWTTSYRLRLRSLFTHLIEELASCYEQKAKWKSAVECYRRGLEADDIVEDLHLGLMRCFLALRRPAEGLGAYRRLRQILAASLGVTPSQESEAVARSLREVGEVRGPQAQPQTGQSSDR